MAACCNFLEYKILLFYDKNDSDFSELKEIIGEDWQFRFRNSIEYFHPQNEKEYKIHWTSEEINKKEM